MLHFTSLDARNATYLYNEAPYTANPPRVKSMQLGRCPSGAEALKTTSE